ncbi:MAG: hypothetical protein VX589_12330 [Myxococcota bacterium]|nr:hypothetical protein [Myxococcota bacterium]
MSRARSALAVRATKEQLIEAALKAFGYEKVKDDVCNQFDGVLDFCRDNSEDLGGAEGCDAWYAWTEGDWALLGDLSLQLHREEDALARLSEHLGDVVVTSIDSGFQFACFSFLADGEMKRLLILEDDELVEDGYPVKAERGRYMDDFGEEEANALWTSYGLSTFEFDPSDQEFTLVTVKV